MAAGAGLSPDAGTCTRCRAAPVSCSERICKSVRTRRPHLILSGVVSSLGKKLVALLCQSGKKPPWRNCCNGIRRLVFPRCFSDLPSPVPSESPGVYVPRRALFPKLDSGYSGALRSLPRGHLLRAGFLGPPTDSLCSHRGDLSARR